MKNVLVVGGGLAGSCVSYQLAEQGINVTLIDNGVNVCTRVSGGAINPLVFRRMTKSWRVDEFLPYLKEFYRSIEAKANQPLLFNAQIRRFFASEQERNYWLTRQDSEAFSHYMNPVTSEDETVYPYANTFGSGRVKECYYMDVEGLLSNLQKHPNITIKHQEFEYASLQPETATYQDKSYDYIIFTEGYLIKNNPWFNYLPVDPTKGEMLTIETEGLSMEESFNRKCFTFYLGNNQYKIGATYDWHTDNTVLTEAGKELLLTNLKSLTPHPAKVVEQTAGIRPTTKDRRPFIGKHAEFEKLVVFNGLGAKGFMMAPLLALELVNHLFHNTEIDKECRIDRIKNI